MSHLWCCVKLGSCRMYLSVSLSPSCALEATQTYSVISPLFLYLSPHFPLFRPRFWLLALCTCAGHTCVHSVVVLGTGQQGENPSSVPFSPFSSSHLPWPPPPFPPCCCPTLLPPSSSSFLLPFHSPSSSFSHLIMYMFLPCSFRFCV